MGKKGGKKKKGGASKADDPDAQVKEQLIAEWRALRKDEKREHGERNQYQLERDKLMHLWEESRQHVDDVKAELRNKDRELQEQSERHAVEKRQYQQRIKHLLFEQQSGESKSRVNSELQVTLQHAEQRGLEQELSHDERALKATLKELEVSHAQVLKHMKLESDKQETALREQFEREVKELMEYYERRMHDDREEMDVQRKKLVAALERKKEKHVQALVAKNQQELRDINEYFKDVINFTMETIKSRKAEVDEWRRTEARNDKNMNELVRENRRLNEPLSAALRETEQLRRKLQAYNKDKEELERIQRTLDTVVGKLTELRWRHEVHEQQHLLMKGEHSDVKDKLLEAVFDVQQRTGLDRLLMERKVEALEEELEKRETQLGEVLLAARSNRPELQQVARRLEEVMAAKDDTVRALTTEIQRVGRAHDDLVRIYLAKLAENGVPLEELGYIPRLITEEVAAQLPGGALAS